MSFDLVAIKADVATIAATVTAAGVAMAGASPTNLDSVPNTPWTVVKNPKGRISPGNFEIVEFDLPVTVYLARYSDAARIDTLAAPFLSAFLDTFRTHANLGGTVELAYIRDWDMDVYYEVASEQYQALDMVFAVLIAGRGAQYTVGT